MLLLWFILIVIVRPPPVIFDYSLALLRVAWRTSAGKERNSWLSACAVLPFAYVVWGTIRNSIVSVADYCLFIYSVHSLSLARVFTFAYTQDRPRESFPVECLSMVDLKAHKSRMYQKEVSNKGLMMWCHWVFEHGRFEKSQITHVPKAFFNKELMVWCHWMSEHGGFERSQITHVPKGRFQQRANDVMPLSVWTWLIWKITKHACTKRKFPTKG